MSDAQITSVSVFAGTMEDVVMSKYKLAMLSFFAAFAVSVAASATARAECSGTEPEHKCIWQFKETSEGAFEELSGEEEATILTEPAEAATILLTGAKHEVKCKEIATLGELKGGKIGKGEADILTLTKCSIPSEETCKIKSKGKAKAGEILVTSIPIKEAERENSGGTTKNILSAIFEQKLKAGAKEIVTLEFGTTEKVDSEGAFEQVLLTGTCTKYPLTTKVTGKVAAEVKANEFNFPSPGLKGNTLEAFSELVTLIGKVKLALDEPGEFKGA